MKAEEQARKAYPDNPYYGGRSAQRLFAEGYEQAIKDIKECIDKRYELHRPEYLKTRSSYLEGVLDGIDTIEQDVDELADD